MVQDFGLPVVPPVNAPEPNLAHSSPARPEQIEHSAGRENRRQDDGLIAALAVEIWRMRRGIARVSEVSSDAVAGPLHQSMERIDDLMAAHQLETRIHDGQPYTTGSTLEVVYVREKHHDLVVIETLQPTILRAGRVIQNGQVILGANAAEGESGGV